MSAATLLVELLCEELPPRALQRLGEGFASGIASGLRERGFLQETSVVRALSTPRRLAMLATEVLSKSPDRPFSERLMPVSVGIDASGAPTPALLKKLAAKGLGHVAVGQLLRESDGKAEQLVYRSIAAGQTLLVGLLSALEEAVENLPIPKVMSYQLADGVTTVKFVRPAHRLVALHGPSLVNVTVLGLDADRITQGHRFQGAPEISIGSAESYEAQLEKDGGVIAEFGKRRAAIAAQLADLAKALGANLGPEADCAALLDEVTALVEMPTVYAGSFEPEFLAVPPECLILTMRQNQKYFPLFDAAGKLTNRFLIVSNMRLVDPSNIVRGNERVVRPRLADARFFFATDHKSKLADRVAQLDAIVYHNKLGTQGERVRRLRKLAVRIQEGLPRGGAGREWADRAAMLAKADLATLMVGEFPELQGIMGKYYAAADGEQPSVVRAIEQHYWPRFSGDTLPIGDTSVAVALADKMEALAGLFGIGQQPTGDKDPYALRRHAVGVIRILVEGGYEIALDQLVNEAFEVFPRDMIGQAQSDLMVFVFDRMRGYLREKGYSANEIESVLCMNPMRLNRVPRQLEAVRAFSALPESESLAAANKRVANILRQAAAKGEAFVNAEKDALKESAEHALFEALANASRIATPLFDTGDYTGYLKAFAVLKAPVDAFFDSVMVMAEEVALRKNRLALLADLRREMNRVADISKLAA